MKVRAAPQPSLPCRARFWISAHFHLPEAEICCSQIRLLSLPVCSYWAPVCWVLPAWCAEKLAKNKVFPILRPHKPRHDVMGLIFGVIHGVFACQNGCPFTMSSVTFHNHGSGFTSLGRLCA